MPLVRILIIFTIGFLYGIFAQGIFLDGEKMAYVFGLSIGFMVTSFIFASIVYLISMIFSISITSEKEQHNDLILDVEYTTNEVIKTTKSEQFTKYWLIVSIVIFVIMTLNTVVQSN
ncbi:MAG: hypothetical protein AB8G11_11200 [Saprospiraceae bacterium]